MKRFKLNIIIAGALTLSLFSSCADSFLNSEPKTSLLDENFYKTEADAEMALVGCYDGYQLTSSGFPIYLVATVASDITLVFTVATICCKSFQTSLLGNQVKTQLIILQKNESKEKHVFYVHLCISIWFACLKMFLY